MYNERKEKLGIFNYLVYGFIILLLLIIVFVIIFKSGKKKVQEKPKEMVLYSEEQLNNIEANYNEALAANMASFKYNAIDYYKDKLGNENVDMSLTLQDFYDKHFIEELQIDDTKCDSKNSNVKVTKINGEYRLDFVLVCGDNNASLDTYLGKYDYCKNSNICEKKVEKKSSNPSTVEPNPSTVEPNQKSDNKYIFYEYTLTPSNEVGSYSEWTSWGKEPISKSLMVDVEVKEETETKTEGCSETKEETYISGYNTETYIAGYVTKKYQVGTSKVQTGTRMIKKNGKLVNEPVYEEQPIYQTKEEPVYKTKETPIYSTRQVTVDNCVSTVKYYRSRKFTYKKGLNYIKYSISNDDSILLNSGYIKTGNTKEL